MFKHRSDGVFAKNADPILGMTSHIMPHRYDAMVQFLMVERCEAMDDYIRKMGDKGVKLTYMHILMASLVRLYASKPNINRFVMNGRVFQRKGIYISFAVKKTLNEEGAEEIIKLRFTGEENIFEVKEKVDAEIAKAVGGNVNDTEKTAKLLRMVPNWLTKFVVVLAKYLDKHGLLPKWLIKVSPFHSGCWITNMKSISTDYVYHHLYDFGTSSMFVGLGKEKLEPVVNQASGELEVGKVVRLGLVIDERICDGFYYAKSIKLVRKCIANPELLEENFKLTKEQKAWNYTKEMKKLRKKEQKRLLKCLKLAKKYS